MVLSQRAHLDVVRRFLDGKRRVIMVYDVVIVVDCEMKESEMVHVSWTVPGSLIEEIRACI